jgi:hypothetical protein
LSQYQFTASKLASLEDDTFNAMKSIAETKLVPRTLRGRYFMDDDDMIQLYVYHSSDI